MVQCPMRIHAPFIPALLFIALAWPCAAQQGRIFEDPTNWDHPESVAVSVEELFPNPRYSHDWQARSFFYVGRLDNGTFFVFNLFHWSLSPIQSWGLLVLVTDERGRFFKYDGSLPAGGNAMKGEGFDFRFGDNLFESHGSQHRVRIELKGFSCDLWMRNLLPPWKPGDGWAVYDKSGRMYNRYAIPAPWAEVWGTMNVFEETMDASGQCTWDSSLTVQPLNRPNSPGFYIRAFSTAETPVGDRLFIDMLYTYTDKIYGGTALPILIVARGGVWAFTTKDFSFRPDDWVPLNDPPYPYPGRFHLSAEKAGWSLEGEFVAERLYSLTDVFQRLPRIMRALAALFVKRPVLYRMVGALRGRLVAPDGTVAELDLPAHGEYVVIK
jgi:hypothetical protein